MPALLRARRPFRRPGSLLAVALLLAPPSARAEDRWTGPDKALHLGVSAALASAGYGVSSLELERPGRFAVGGAVALGAGIAKTRDLRCGKYVYWTDWVIVTRNGGVEVAPTNAVAGTNNAITAYRDAAIANNPLPEFWGATNDMFVAKNDDKGPHLFLPTNGNGVAASSVCGNTGSIQ